jgi:glycosyltransferase EpsE
LDYKNFKVVITDDASSDYTYELILQWIEEYETTNNIVVLKNDKRMTALPNIHRAITKHCDPSDIILMIDGDDEILGRHALKVFNHFYQKNEADVVYSNNAMFYHRKKLIDRGWSKPYTIEKKKIATEILI